MRYICSKCGFIYDEQEGCPEKGITAGTKWQDLPSDFECPLCGENKDGFYEE